MQLYHHPYSLDSQRARLALEEKKIDYTSFHVNPLTGKNLDASFFRVCPGKLPVLKNGSQLITESAEIVLYIDRVSLLSLGVEQSLEVCEETKEWMRKMQSWDSTLFTLCHIPSAYRQFVSKFLRRVLIARMATFPDLASAYHQKLQQVYERERRLEDARQLNHYEEQLHDILNDAELRLNTYPFLSGKEFGMLDYMFVPILGRLSLLNLEEKYIVNLTKVRDYWKVVQLQPSYKVVIGKYFTGWRKYKTLLKTVFFLGIRRVFRRY